MKISVTAAAMASLALAGVASAQVLYQQSAHTVGAAGGNGLSTFFGGVENREIADDFAIPSPGWNVDGASINGVFFDGSSTATPANLIVRFYENASGVPGTQVGSDIVAGNVSNTLTGATYFTRPERVFAVSFPAVTLPAGSYFVSIIPEVGENWFTLTSTPTTPLQGSPIWGRSRTGAPSGAYGVNWTSSQTIFAAEHDVAFALFGTVVPSPGAFSLLALGGLFAARRRRA